MRGVRASHWTCQVSDFHLAPNANTTWSSELRNAAGFRPRLDLGLRSLWGGMFCYWYQHSATPSVTPFNKDFQSLLLYLVFYKDSDMITVFPSGQNPSWMSFSERYFDPMESKLVIICQHRITMYELIVPKWSVCIGFFFSLFLFPSVYTCCCISKEGFGGQSWNVGAKTQSTLFENHKGLGLRWSLFQ